MFSSHYTMWMDRLVRVGYNHPLLLAYLQAQFIMYLMLLTVYRMSFGLALFMCACLVVVTLLRLAPFSLRQHRSFIPQVYGAGQLYYDGSVPVLCIRTSDSYHAGKIHGYI